MTETTDPQTTTDPSPPYGTTWVHASSARPELLAAGQPDEHRWVVLVTHRVDARTAARIFTDGGVDVVLDGDSMARVDLACFMCEQPPTDQVRLTPCPGQPR